METTTKTPKRKKTTKENDVLESVLSVPAEPAAKPPGTTIYVMPQDTERFLADTAHLSNMGGDDHNCPEAVNDDAVRDDTDEEERAIVTPIPDPVDLDAVAPNATFTKFRTHRNDTGDTRLIDCPDWMTKNNAIFSVIGTIAELNAAVGVARANTNAQWAAALPVIQEHLGEIERCVSQKFPPEWKRAEDKIFFLIKGQVEMEKLFQRQFNRTDYFPLPGGHPVAAFLHLAAAICWRAERACVAILPPNDPNREAILVYLNRLHHVLQLLARRANRTYGTVDPIAGA